MYMCSVLCVTHLCNIYTGADVIKCVTHLCNIYICNICIYICNIYVTYIHVTGADVIKCDLPDKLEEFRCLHTIVHVYM